ncbi:MAG: prolyl oligopeptidase family serine peptidase [Chloroflexi bacterium]|nr:prolyl oligopeptidase family serine peptidase [Chloroflexota bacterium]
MAERRPYGTWESPITPAALAGGIRLRGPSWDSDGRTLGWFEGRGDRGVAVAASVGGGDAALRDISGDILVRAGVGYGGGDYTLANGQGWFVDHDSQRIFRQPLDGPDGGPALPVTPAFGESSSPAVSPDGRWVAFVHSYEDEDVIAIADATGELWPGQLARGRDFYMQPVWSPAGDRIAWVEWDHPNMPWDGSELRVAKLAFAEGALPAVAASEVVAGGPQEAVLQPAFSPSGDALHYISDATGWGHLYRYDLATGESRALTSGPCEYGTPAWGQGVGMFAVLPSGRVVATRQRQGFARLVLIDGHNEPHELDLPAEYASFENPVASPVAEHLAVIASGPTASPRLLVLDLEADPPGVVERRLSDPDRLPAASLSLPRAVSWTNAPGSEVHGLYYPPASERFFDDGPPPLVVFVHGGPTDHVDAGWRPQVQFLASRGYAVLAVNYRGSSGAGREAMLALRGEWGVADVEDCRSGAEAMAARGLADGDRLAILGGSAGGYTVLRSLQVHPGFYRAGVCYYGISNLFTLASDTHKFEARYLDSLVGPLPEATDRYRERSPIFHAGDIVDPIALFQGVEDRVVPRDQSDTLAASLRSRGVPHEYHVYEGEGHGWRKRETIEAFYSSVERFLRGSLLG